MEDKSGQNTENEETVHDEETNDNSENVAQTVGHNMYILAYQVLILLNHLVSRHRYRYKFDIYQISLCFTCCTSNGKVFSGTKTCTENIIHTEEHFSSILFSNKYLAIPTGLSRDDGQ
jgi:hypothetical protein